MPLVVALAAIVMALGIHSCSASAQSEVEARARAIHRETPLIDGHNDYPWLVRQNAAGDTFVPSFLAPAKASLSHVVDHMDHIRRVAGPDHVGIGSDFDGIPSVPIGLPDVSAYPALTAELLRRGWPEDDVKKALGLNVLRAMGRAEEVSARLSRLRGASVATIKALDPPIGQPPPSEAVGVNPTK